MCQLAKCVVMYIKNICSKYKLNAYKPALKLISYKENENPAYVEFLVQIMGKNVFPSLSGQDFIDDDTLLSYFKQKDQQTIGSLLNPHSDAKKHQIVSRTYEHSSKACIFTIAFTDKNNETRYVQINDFGKLLKHLDLFSREDIFIIGYEIGKTFGK